MKRPAAGAEFFVTFTAVDKTAQRRRRKTLFSRGAKRRAKIAFFGAQRRAKIFDFRSVILGKMDLGEWP